MARVLMDADGPGCPMAWEIVYGCSWTWVMHGCGYLWVWVLMDMGAPWVWVLMSLGDPWHGC